MSKVAGDTYLGAIKDSLDSPNMILDLRVPQNQKYQQVVLDEAIARFLAGEIDREQTVKAVSTGGTISTSRSASTASSSSTRVRSESSADALRLFPARSFAQGSRYPLQPHRERE